MAGAPRSLLPLRYSSPDTSKLVHEVSATSINDFSFDLVDRAFEGDVSERDRQKAYLMVGNVSRLRSLSI